MNPTNLPFIQCWYCNLPINKMDYHDYDNSLRANCKECQTLYCLYQTYDYINNVFENNWHISYFYPPTLLKNAFLKINPNSHKMQLRCYSNTPNSTLQIIDLDFNQLIQLPIPKLQSKIHSLIPFLWSPSSNASFAICQFICRQIIIFLHYPSEMPSVTPAMPTSLSNSINSSKIHI